MANQPYLVVRLIPSAPIDGATFATYLDGLQLQVIDAYTGEPLSDFVYSSPLAVFNWPLGSGGGTALASASNATSAATTYVSANDYGNQLTFDSTAGISVGSYVFTNDQNASGGPVISSSDNYQVTDVTAGTVTLNANLNNYVPAGTVISFIGNAFTSNLTNPSSAATQFALPTTGPATSSSGGALVVLPFADTSGVTVGMIVTGTDIAATGTTTVAEVTATAVTLSQALQANPPTGTNMTFTLSAPFASLTLTPTGSSGSHLTFSSTNRRRFGLGLSPE